MAGDAGGKKSSKPAIAGIFIILSGFLGIIGGLGYIDQASYITSVFGPLGKLFGLCGFIILIFAVLALLGGLLLLLKRNLFWGISGGFFGIMAIGFGPGALLAFVALILIFLSRKEFD